MKARNFFKAPKLIVAICLLLTVFFGFSIKGISIHNSLRDWLSTKNESHIRLEKTEQEFGSMIALGVSIENKKGEFLTAENIEVVRKITDRILEIGEVDNVDSLTHIDYVCDTDGTISATQLIPDSYTGSKEDIQQLKNRLTEWSDMYDRVLLNDKKTATQIQITIHSPNDEEKAAMKISENERQQNVLNQVRQIVEEETENHPLKYEIYGDPVINENAKEFMLSDLMFLIPLVVIVILISLFLSFKTLDGTILPLITVGMATVWTVGIMSLLNAKFDIISSVIPVALIAVGSAYGIHVLTHYYIALDSTDEELTKEKYFDAVMNGLKEVMSAVLLAGITTMVGFISCITSPIQPLHSFAIFTSVGVGISLLLSITFIPSLLLCKDVKKVRTKSTKIEHLTARVKARLERAKRLAGGKSTSESTGNTFYKVYKFFCGSKPRLICFIAMICVFSFVGLKKIHIDTSLVSYFPEDCDLRQGINYVDKEFAGTNSLYFLIEGDEKGDITNPEILKSVDEMQEYLKGEFSEIGKIASFTTFIKRINQVWHVPQQKNFVFNEENSIETQDDSFETLSFGDTEEFNDFADFGDFSEFGIETETQSSAPQNTVDFVDPNIEYLEKLETPVTTSDVIQMLNDAYVKCGTQNATPQKMLEYIEKNYNYNGMAYYEIPYEVEKYPVVTREELNGVIQNYLTLLSGSLGRFVDDETNPSIMRVQCQLRTRSTEKTNEIINAARNFAKENFPEGYKISFTGSAEMEYTMTNLIISSQITSLLISLLSVIIILTISFKSLFAGLIGAIPLALTIFLNYMTMGFAGINLDLVTSIIASVAVGVGIDYTIHFLSTYKEERAKSDDLDLVTQETFKKSGHAIFTNAVAVGFGFLVLCLSRFIVLRYIGVLVAIVMFTSSILAMTVIPGILNQFQPKFMIPKEELNNK